MKVTVQLFLDGTWQDAMVVEFANPAAGLASPTRSSYQDEFVLSRVESLGTIGAHAVSVRMPLGFEIWESDAWPAFLYDIVPVGAARKFWERRLGLHRDDRRDDLRLLTECCSAPIGHARIKEAAETLPTAV